MRRSQFIKIAALYYIKPKEHKRVMERLSAEELLEYRLLEMFWLQEQELARSEGCLH
jgi:hypothetical protein